MKKKRIIISVINNLECDQRIHKVATTLYNNGFDILVIGSQNTPCHSFKQPYPTKRLPVFFKKGFLFYGEYNIRLFFLLLFSKCDILLANDTDTIIPNFLISKIKKKKIILDLHELFPEVPEVVNRKFVKNTWTAIESFIFPHIKTGYTVCQSIADYYKKIYGMNLHVVRNVPYPIEYKKNPDLLHFENKKIILYQGAVNIGRGIEWIIDAMPYIDNAVFVIIGKGDMYKELKEKTKRMNLEDRVIFKGYIPFQELAAYTSCADLGVCLLKNQGLSYFYSLPNRVFDYMQAHVPLLASNFPEITKILKTYNTGYLIDHYEPDFLAQTINEILSSPIDHSIYDKANKLFNWQNEEKILLGIFNQK